MTQINNTLTVGELRALLDQYEDDSLPVMMITSGFDEQVKVRPIDRTVIMDWYVDQNAKLRIVPPLHPRGTGSMVGLFRG